MLRPFLIHHSACKAVGETTISRRGEMNITISSSSQPTGFFFLHRLVWKLKESLVRAASAGFTVYISLFLSRSICLSCLIDFEWFLCAVIPITSSQELQPLAKSKVSCRSRSRYLVLGFFIRNRDGIVEVGGKKNKRGKKGDIISMRWKRLHFFFFFFLTLRVAIAWWFPAI